MEEGKIVEMNPNKSDSGIDVSGVPQDTVAKDVSKKISYEQLERVAQQAHEQAEVWRKRAYEASAKFGRIDLILNCLSMNIQYMKEKCLLFDATAVETMSRELMDVLYPTGQENMSGGEGNEVMQ